ELNSKLQAENTELRNKNAKLRQALEGHETRITKLEQGENSISTKDVLQSSVNIISTKTENSNDAPASDISDNTSSSDISEQVENRSNTCQDRDSQYSAPPIPPETNSNESLLSNNVAVDEKNTAGRK
ncbi:7752_t:CDS:2, partial [Ambispora gerdemannii]